MNISTRTTRTKIKTGPGPEPIIGTRNERDRDQFSGTEITGTGGLVPVSVPIQKPVPVAVLRRSLPTSQGVEWKLHWQWPYFHHKTIKTRKDNFGLDIQSTGWLRYSRWGKNEPCDLQKVRGKTRQENIFALIVAFLHIVSIPFPYQNTKLM